MVRTKLLSTLLSAAALASMAVAEEKKVTNEEYPDFYTGSNGAQAKGDDFVQAISVLEPAYRAEVSPTRGMGKIAELFRSYPGTVRSDHPQVSFTANGKQSAEITKNHPLTPQFGMDSPLGALYRLNAKILLLGVGYGNCTS